MLMYCTSETHAAQQPVAGALERAAAVARLDSALARHPLAPAWAYRARLDAIRHQAAVDGRLIDSWHLAVLIEGESWMVSHRNPGGSGAAARPNARPMGVANSGSVQGGRLRI
jgi:hypothetical protein